MDILQVSFSPASQQNSTDDRKMMQHLKLTLTARILYFFLVPLIAKAYPVPVPSNHGLPYFLMILFG
jgi:hypothetical protein